MVSNELPVVEVGAAFDRLTNDIEKTSTRRRRRYAVAAAAAAVVVVSGVVAATQDDRDSSPAPADQPVNAIAVATGVLQLVRPDGTTAANLGPGGFPAFSPDGSRMVFVTPGLIGEPQDLMIADTDGTDIRTLVDCRGIGRSCGAGSWSPDGTQVAVPVFDGPRAELRIVTVSTGDERTYEMPAGEGFDFPVWSPDGSRLAGVHITERASWVATMDRPSGHRPSAT